ncbi:MAG: 1,4-dihydroxy-6-naphthoate synthase [Caldimicrobium sp.]
MHPTRLEIALSPCPNDVFFLSGLILKKILSPFALSFHFADIESLNEAILKKEFPVIKASFAVYPEVFEDYEILGAGAALGFGVGPILVSNTHLKENFLGLKIAIPGKYTTAHFLWNLFFGTAYVEKIFIPYNEIIPALKARKVDLGILIHEGRFVYEKYGLFKISDLGELWEKKTHLPLPLGGFFIKRDLPKDIKRTILKLFRKSLEYALQHQEEIYPLLKQYAQEMDRETLFRHVKTFVNEYTYKLEGEGLEALKVFLKFLGLKGNISEFLWEEEDGIS